MADDRPPPPEGRTDQEKFRAEAARLLFEHIDDGVVLLDGNGRVLAVNPAFERLTGHAGPAVLGRPASEIGVFDQTGSDASNPRERETLYHGRTGSGFAVWERRCLPEQRPGWQLLRFTRLDEQPMLRIANRDVLTGLPNRALFMERLRHALARMERTRESIAVLFIDLDHFKHINDALGHAVGDAFLEAVARRLKEQVRDGDTLARYGGDEFCLLLESLAHPEDAARVAEKILGVLDQPVEAGDYSLTLGASIGIAVAAGGHVEAQSLIRQADQAMYRVKRGGGGSFRMARVPNGAAEGLSAFARCGELHRGQFEIRYRPFGWIGDGAEWAMVEVELRWQCDGRRLEAEALGEALRDNGLQNEVEQWFVEQVLGHLARWLEQGLEVPLLAIRLAGHHLFCAPEKGVFDRLVHAGDAWRGRLLVEIPLALLGENPALVAPCLRRMQAQGLRIGVEDFGAHCASLSFFEHFLPDMVKLDSSLVEGFPSHPVSSALVRAICRIGSELGVRIAVGGMQVPETRAALREAGCHWAPVTASPGTCSEREFVERLGH